MYMSTLLCDCCVWVNATLNIKYGVARQGHDAWAKPENYKFFGKTRALVVSSEAMGSSLARLKSTGDSGGFLSKKNPLVASTYFPEFVVCHYH